MVPVEPADPTALTAVAMGIGAATLTEMLLLAIVPEAFVPLNPAVAATKSLPRFEAIAVVSHAGCWNQTVFGPPAAVLCDSVIDCDPASTQSIPVDTPVLPAVCPVLLTPNALIALWLVCAATVADRLRPAVLCVPLRPMLAPAEVNPVPAYLLESCDSAAV